MLKTKAEIQVWLDEMSIKNYTINDDLTVDVDGNVNLSRRKLTEIPVQFRRVKLGFYCSYNMLTSLKGAPKECKFFDCSGNLLTTLEFVPKECETFYCSDNKIKESRLSKFRTQEVKNIGTAMCSSGFETQNLK